MFIKSILLIVTLILVNFAAHCQWSLVLQESNPEIWFDDLEIAEDGTVYALSVGKIYRSIDFGETWSIDSTWGNGSTKIQFVSADTGYVCCGLEDYDENHLMTVDGGLSWMPCGTDINFSILNIEYLPGNLIKAVEGGLWSSIMGGKYCLSLIWQDTLATMGDVYDLDVLNDSVLFMCGNIFPADSAFSTTIKSVDNGYHWQVSGDGFDVPYYGMDWPTDSVGYGNGLADMYKTIDQGESWSKLPNPFGEDDFTYIYGVPFFINRDVGLVVAARHPIDNPSLDEILGILRTDNGGESWYLTDTPDDAKGSNNIDCWKEDTCFYTYFRSIYRTTNGGGIGEPLDFLSLQKLSIHLHPNPTSSTLSITGLEAYKIENITTYSIDGRIVDLPFHNGQADVSHLAPGIYLTTVQTEQGKWQEKWVKL